MGMIYKGLTFDGVNSLDYGIYITGEGVYNAPTRDVEMITIAGRNGEYALDKGRFNNISITYNAGTFGQDQTDFAEKISDFRNAILSRVGYKRLEDDYHTDEYRMAVYMDGLEVDPTHYSEAGEFELTFNCKPQRFLKSGETEQTIASGGTITNPTPFESQPLLLLDGYGNIDIEGQTIEVSGEPIGEVNLVNSGTVQNRQVFCEFTESNAEKLNEGDIITIGTGTIIKRCEIKADWLSRYKFDDIYIRTDVQSTTTGSASLLSDGAGYTFRMDIPIQTFEYGTALSRHYVLYMFCDYTLDGTTTHSTLTGQYSVSYDGARQIEVYVWATANDNRITTTDTVTVGATTAESTKLLGDNIYIDLDLGEAYKITDGVIISANSNVSLPARLPELKTGANAITYDNTITSLKVTPRWWKI